MPTPHKHAEFIKAWADGQEVQVMTNSGWADVALIPSWLDSNEYRIKPAAPKWPQTTMGDSDLILASMGLFGLAEQQRATANAVIAHECRTGALVPADKVREIEVKARAEGMKEGSVWDGDRDRMVIRETLKSQGVSWTSALVDHVIHRLPK